MRYLIRKGVVIFLAGLFKFFLGHGFDYGSPRLSFCESPEKELAAFPLSNPILEGGIMS